jgi:hypothetical protein
MATQWLFTIFQTNMEFEKEKIQKNKLYSIRKTMSFIPWITNAPTMKKEIVDNNNIFNYIQIRREKKSMYYVKGENIIKYLEIKEKEYNE